jgi:hypothetical protein
MRKDMDKVIVERARVGHARPSKKTGLRLRSDQLSEDFDSGPMRLPTKRARAYGWWESKELTDRLGPLKRFLYSQVGRPWDKVYRDIRDSIDARTVTGRHLLHHVDQMVWVDVPPEGPKPWDQLYVHPRTGLLCLMKARRG